MYELNMEEGHGELNASHYLAHTPHSIVHPGKAGQGYQPQGHLLPANYLQPLSRASHAQSGAITVKEHQQKMHSRQRADSVSSICKTQTANNNNPDNARLAESQNPHALVSPLNKNNHVGGLTALTPIELDQRNTNYDLASIHQRFQ